MDRTLIPTPLGCRFSISAAPLGEDGEVWSWRLTTPDGDSLAGLSPDPVAARRSAAFAAFTLTALARIGRRRF